MIDGGVLALLILLVSSGSLLVSVSALVYQHTICFLWSFVEVFALRVRSLTLFLTGTLKLFVVFTIFTMLFTRVAVAVISSVSAFRCPPSEIPLFPPAWRLCSGFCQLPPSFFFFWSASGMGGPPPCTPSPPTPILPLLWPPLPFLPVLPFVFWSYHVLCLRSGICFLLAVLGCPWSCPWWQCLWTLPEVA